MKIATFSRFNGWVGPADNNLGGGQLDPDVRWVAIAPGSEVDCCLVDGRLLSPGVVLPASEGAALVPVRSMPSGGIAGGNAGVSDAVDRLQLLTWTACETPFTPGPRGPAVREGRFDAAGLPVGSYTRALRVPFQGRRHGTFLLTCAIGTFSVIVRGVRYLPRIAMVSGDPLLLAVEPAADEAAAVAYSGGVSLVANSDPAGLTLHVGGTDSAEAYDEIQLWVKPSVFAPANVAQSMFIVGEAFGERAP